MNLRPHFARAAFPALLAAFMLLALLYSVTIPLGEAPDEVSHFGVIAFLSTYKQLPTLDGAALGEAHQPPLYYLIAALSTAWIPLNDWQVIANPDYVIDDPQTPNLLIHSRNEAFPYQGATLAWHLVRLLSVVMGAVTVWATWGIARELFDDDRWIAFGAASFVSFLPMFTFLSAVVNNDNLIIMLSSLVVLQFVSMLHRPIRKTDAVILGALLGLAALTKLTGLVLFPFAGTLLLYRARQSAERTRDAVQFVLCFGIAALLASPWWIYNWVNYHDPLGTPLTAAVVSARQVPFTPREWLELAQGLYTSFWARFGGAMQIGVPDAFMLAFGVVPVLALIGWVLYLRDWRSARISAGARTLLILSSLFGVLILGAYVRWMLTLMGTDQARQLFAGLPLLAIFLFAGFMRALAPRRQMALAAWSGGLVALGVGVFAFAISFYATPVRNDAASIPPSGEYAPADFGRAIRVISYRIDRTRVAPGASIGVQVYWQALNDPREDYWLLFQLDGPDGSVANKDGVPSAGRRTTDWWRAGEVLSSRHTLFVPGDVAPGTYTLKLGLHPFGRWEWLRVAGQDMLALASIQVTPKSGQ